MKVRFFTADTIQEAMGQVKTVLGRDAIILHTRTFRKGGILGLFAKEKVEVMAGVDLPTASVQEPTKAPAVNFMANAYTAPAPPIEPESIAPNQPVETLAEPVMPKEAIVSSDTSAQNESVAIVKPVTDTNEPVVDSQSTQQMSVSTIVENVIQQTEEKENKNLAAVQLELANLRDLLEQVLCNDQKEVQRFPILELLLSFDIDFTIAEEIIASLPVKIEKEAPVTSELKQMIIEKIMEKLQCTEGIKVPEVGRKIVAFMGSTGVGKTTTIAKLAAKFAIQEGKSVALVTADTYRVSAVEQLKTYSDIMGIPIYVVYTAEELKNVLDTTLDTQLILIDTAGRSPHNHDQIEELQKLLQIDDSIEKHLVLSTTTKYKDALDVVENFSVCLPDKVIFTKVDEARNIGTIVNLLYRTPLLLSYITNGQNVPDDIELVDPDKLAQLVFRD